LFSDGTAVKLVGEETFRLTRELVDDLRGRQHRCGVRGDQGHLRRHPLHRRARWRAWAWPRSSSTRLSTAARASTYIAINCGANMNFDRLRFVAERAEVGEEREALMAVTIPRSVARSSAFAS
jgi:threonine dehydratase